MEQLSASMVASHPIFGHLTQYERYQEPKKFHMKELFAVRGFTHPCSDIRHPSSHPLPQTSCGQIRTKLKIGPLVLAAQDGFLVGV
jgi:hypothetical protein